MGILTFFVATEIAGIFGQSEHSGCLLLAKLRESGTLDISESEKLGLDGVMPAIELMQTSSRYLFFPSGCISFQMLLRGLRMC